MLSDSFDVDPLMKDKCGFDARDANIAASIHALSTITWIHHSEGLECHIGRQENPHYSRLSRNVNICKARVIVDEAD